jgi:hypothetical protein
VDDGNKEERGKTRADIGRDAEIPDEHREQQVACEAPDFDAEEDIFAAQRERTKRAAEVPGASVGNVKVTGRPLSLRSLLFSQERRDGPFSNLCEAGPEGGPHDTVELVRSDIDALLAIGEQTDPDQLSRDEAADFLDKADNPWVNGFILVIGIYCVVDWIVLAIRSKKAANS